MSLPTSAVAWYGAVVSSLGFLLALYVALRDRPRLKIEIRPNMHRYGDLDYPEDNLYVMISVNNVGRRPVTVTMVAITQRRKAGDFLLSDSMREGAKEITEGKSATYLAHQEGMPFPNLAHVIVRDAAGRKWKRRVPRRVRRTPVLPPTPQS